MRGENQYKNAFHVTKATKLGGNLDGQRPASARARAVHNKSTAPLPRQARHRLRRLRRQRQRQRCAGGQRQALCALCGRYLGRRHSHPELSSWGSFLKLEKDALCPLRGGGSDWYQNQAKMQRVCNSAKNENTAPKLHTKHSFLGAFRRKNPAGLPWTQGSTIAGCATSPRGNTFAVAR